MDDHEDTDMLDEGVGEEDDRKHNQLIDAVTALDGKKNNRLSQRSVISNQISEFNFARSKDKGSKVSLSELVGTLHDTALHKDFRQQISKIQGKKEVVAVPTPKHEREKIQRKVAYEKTAEEVTKWDPIVEKNRLADQIIFPLEKPDVRILTGDQLVQTFKPRTPLEMEVAALLGRSEHVITNKKQALTPAEKRALEAMDINEAKERRRELMRHRALLSYKQAKSKRQNKIKSKSFHRVLKKEKSRKEEKVLAEMEKNDPEGFAEKMKLLDRQRIHERMSLKHRGASKFEKRQKLFAKYDDTARNQVQSMLQLSRDLTKKHEVEIDEGDDSEGGVSLDSEDENNMLDSEASLMVGKNPWMSQQKIKTKSTKKKKTDSLSVKAPMDTNEENDSGNEFEGMKDEEEVNLIGLKDADDGDDGDEQKSENDEERTDNTSNMTDDIEDIFKNFEPKKHKKSKGQKSNMNADAPDDTKNDNKHEEMQEENTNKGDRNKKSKKPKKAKKVNKKKVEDVKEDSEMDDHDDDDDDDDDDPIMKENLSRKRTLEDFSDDSDTEVTPQKKVKISSVKKGGKSGKGGKAESKGKKGVEEAYVDPKKLMMIESKIHHTGEGLDIVDEDDDEGNDEDDQRMMIAQAFADDDVIEEFKADKEEEIEKKKVKDIDLTLPGWGDWGGEGVKPVKKKRMRIKAPKGARRKDRFKGHVIINEDKLKDVSKHQVDSLPFPYTSVEQYEASIRAPIGETWNTPSAFMELTKPKVVTKLGTIIAPIDKERTFKKEKDAEKAKEKIGDNSDKNTGKHKGGNFAKNDVKGKGGDSSKKGQSKSKKGGKLSKLKKMK